MASQIETLIIARDQMTGTLKNIAGELNTLDRKLGTTGDALKRTERKGFEMGRAIEVAVGGILTEIAKIGVGAVKDFFSLGFNANAKADAEEYKSTMEGINKAIAGIAEILTKPLFDLAMSGLQDLTRILTDPAIVAGAQAIADTLGKLPGIANDIGGGIAGSGFGQWLGELGGALSEAGTQIGTALQPALDALAPVLDEIGKIVGPIIAEGFRLVGQALIRDVIPNITKSVTEFLLAIPPFVEFAKTVKDKVVEAITFLGQKWDELNTFIADTAGFINDTKDKFFEIVDVMMGPVADGFQWFKEHVLDPMTRALADLKSYIGQVMDALRNLAGAIGGAVSDPLGGLGGIINGAAGGIKDRLGGGVGGGVNNFGGSRTQNNNINIVLPNVRTERDARQVANALNGIARGAMLRGAQGLT